VGAERNILRLVLSALLCGAAARLPAQETRDRRVVSATGRFVALSPAGQDATYLVVWAEDVVERLQKLLGMALPVPRGEALYLIVGPGEGAISAEQYYDEFGLRQKLHISGIEAADQEQVLEHLCRFLLNRQTLPEQVPFWFAAGAAQNLFPEARVRNMETAISEWRADRAPDFSDITGGDWPDTPDFRTRAFAGLAVAALLEWFPDSARTEQFLSACAAGQTPAAELAAQLTGRGSVRDLEAAWDVWLASRQNIRIVGAGSPRQDAERLRAMLEITPVMIQLVAGRKVPGEFSAQRMIAERAEDWVPAAARHLDLKLESFSLGCAPETQGVIRAWRDFLQTLSVRDEKRPWYSLRKAPAVSERELLVKLARAEQLLFELAEAASDE